MTWLDLADREGLVIDGFWRYVDDCRIILPSLNEGWRWGGFRFIFKEEYREEEIKSSLSDQQRNER